MKQNRMLFITTHQPGKGSLPQGFSFAATAAFVLAVSPAATAATATWDGGGNNSNWGNSLTGTNWDSATVPTFDNTFDAVFNTVGAARLSNVIGDNRTIRSLTFNDNADTAISIRLAASSTTSENLTLTLDTDTVGGNAQIVVNSDAVGTITLGVAGGSISLADPLLVTHNGTSTLTINRPISDNADTYGLTKDGTGTLILSAANTYDGTTTLNAGTLRVGVDSVGTVGAITSSAIGTGGLTFNGGGLSSNGGTARTILNAVTFTGNATLGDASNTGKLTFSAAADLGTAVRTLTVNNAAQFDGIIIGVGGGITKEGTGTLTLAGTNNDYTGLTTANAGVLQVNHANALGSTAAGTVVNGSNGASNFFGTALELNGVSIGSGESLTLDSGTVTDFRVTLRTAGTTSNTWAGGVSLTGNKAVQFNSGSAGGSLEISGAITQSSFTGFVNLRGSGTGTLSGGMALASGTRVQLLDAGTWNINTSGNTWGNTTVYNGATLVLGIDGALPSTTTLTLGTSTGDSSGTLKLNGKSQTIAGLAISGTGTANKIVNGNATAGALTVNNSAANAFAGVLGGTGTDENNFSLTKTNSGTLTLSGTNTHSGTTTISAGVLQLGNGGTTGALTGTTGITNDANLTVNRSDAFAQATDLNGQSIGGSGSFTQAGAGTTTLSLANTYSGATTISVGTLAIGSSGSITNSSSVVLGTAGTLDTSVIATYAVPAAQPVTFNIDPTGSGTSGKITAAGLDITNAVVTLSPSATLDDPVYVLATYTGTLGGSSFAAPLPTVPSGYTLNYAYEGNKIALVQDAGFSTWITGTFANGPVALDKRGPNDDPDNDGIRNLVEYAIASQDPTVANASIGNFTGTSLSFDKRLPLATDITYAIVESTDLGLADIWAEVSGGAYVNDGTTISYTFTPGTPAKDFFRLQVTQNIP